MKYDICHSNLDSLMHLKKHLKLETFKIRSMISTPAGWSLGKGDPNPYLPICWFSYNNNYKKQIFSNKIVHYPEAVSYESLRNLVEQKTTQLVG